MIRKITITCFASLALVAAGAGAASAGEVTGNGKATPAPERAASICVFSGLNDDQEEEPGRTQSYGQLVRQGIKQFLPSPGDACNPTKGFEE
jgi:hypothetical protein